MAVCDGMGSGSENGYDTKLCRYSRIREGDCAERQMGRQKSTMSWMTAGSRMAGFVWEFTDSRGDHQNPPGVGNSPGVRDSPGVGVLSESGGTLREWGYSPRVRDSPRVGSSPRVEGYHFKGRSFLKDILPTKYRPYDAPSFCPWVMPSLKWMPP